MKLRIGDNVKVNTGSNKGKTGKIQKVVEDKRKVVVEGINVYKKHNRKNMVVLSKKHFPWTFQKSALFVQNVTRLLELG